MSLHPDWCVHRWPHPTRECSAVHRRDCECKGESVERSDLPEGQQSRMSWAEAIAISKASFDEAEWRRATLAEHEAAAAPCCDHADIEARVRAVVSEEIARAIEGIRAGWIDQHEPDEIRGVPEALHDAAAMARVVGQYATQPAESVVAALLPPAGHYDWAVRLKSSRGGEWVLPRDDEAHARQFVKGGPDGEAHPDAVVVRRWVGDWESALPDVAGAPEHQEAGDA